MENARFYDIGHAYIANPPRDGWEIDEDYWHRRLVRGSDPFKHSDFNTSCHAFIDKGWLYCRDADQAAELDAGRVV